MRGVWAALGLCMLAGCASGQEWTYSRPGLTPARLDLDLEACRKQAHRPYWFAVTRSRRVDQDVLNQCMERKGYTPRRDE
ncbi:MAG TPA: hypothetical protein VGJ70_09470 [Solirubrobacteraceae bacterium]